MDTSANTDNRRKIKYKVAWTLSFSAQVLAIMMAAYFPARLIAENNPYVYPVPSCNSFIDSDFCIFQAKNVRS